MLSLPVTCILFVMSLWTQEADGHVRLTFPPARQYAIDFLDNVRTTGPCGSPKYDGAPRTTVVEGTSLRATWHLSYAHRGGAELQIIKENPTIVLASLTGGEFVFQNDSTRQYADIVLPVGLTCADCTLRLLRQASEWGGDYRFWSCADITILPHADAATAKCSNASTTSADHKTPTGEPEANGEPEPEVTAEPESSVKPEPEVTAEPESSGEPEPKATSEPEPIATPEPEAEAYPEPEGTAEPEQAAAINNEKAGNACIPETALQFDSCYDGKCLNGGTCGSSDGKCSCLRLFSGDRCEVFDRCWSDSDCNNGKCIDTRSTTHPRRLCYCQQGWYTDDCSKKSNVVIQDDYETNSDYKSKVLSSVVTVYWKVESDEIEIALRAKTLSWVGLGWRPSNLIDTCKAFPSVASASQVDSKYLEFVNSQKGLDTSGPSFSLDPEQAIEVALESNIETKCSGGGDKTDNGNGNYPEPEPSAPEPEPSGRGIKDPAGHPEPPQIIPEFISYSLPVPEYQALLSEPEPGAEGEPYSHSEPESNGEPESHGEPEPNGEPNPFGTKGKPLTHPMDCTDMVIGSVKGDLHRVQDMYTKDRSTPRPDFAYNGADDLTGSAGSQVDGVTTIVFRKKLQATHSSDHTISNQLMSVIWAVGQGVDRYIHAPKSGLEACTATDTRFYRHDELKYHGHGGNQRGTASLNFFSSDGTQQAGTCAVERSEFKEPSNCDITTGGFNCAYYASWAYNQADDTINFVLKSKQVQTRWIGLGFSSNQKMQSTDALTAWIDGEGNPVVKDRWATGYFAPATDETNNVESVSGSYQNGVMTIQFKRARSTDDKENDLGFTDSGCQYMMYASGPLNGAGTDILKHSTTPIISSAQICIKPCSAQKKIGSFSGTLSLLGETFTADLNNKSSSAYKSLKKEAEEILIATLRKDNARSMAVEVTGFKAGSIIVIYTVTYVYDDADEEDNTVKASLKAALVKQITDNGGKIGTYSAEIKFDEEATSFPDWIIAVVCAAVMAVVLVLTAVVSMMYRSKQAKGSVQAIDMEKRDNVDQEASFPTYQQTSSRSNSMQKEKPLDTQISKQMETSENTEIPSSGPEESQDFPENNDSEEPEKSSI